MHLKDNEITVYTVWVLDHLPSLRSLFPQGRTDDRDYSVTESVTQR